MSFETFRIELAWIQWSDNIFLNEEIYLKFCQRLCVVFMRSDICDVWCPSYKWYELPDEVFAKRRFCVCSRHVKCALGPLVVKWEPRLRWRLRSVLSVCRQKRLVKISRKELATGRVLKSPLSLWSRTDKQKSRLYRRLLPSLSKL